MNTMADTMREPTTEIHIPHNAEHHLRSDFVRTVPGEMSVLVSGKRQASTEEFFCPNCDCAAPVPLHGILGRCTNCQLEWVSYGNSLYLWRS